MDSRDRRKLEESIHSKIAVNVALRTGELLERVCVKLRVVLKNTGERVRIQ